MTMTLKLEYRDWPNSTADDLGEIEFRQAWIGGVQQVTKIATVHPDDLLKVNERFMGFSDNGIEIWTWMSAEQVKVNRTLIGVTFVGNEAYRVLLVERAWLLGPDGGTIERIAP